MTTTSHLYKQKYPWVLYGVFLFALIGNISFWAKTNKIKPTWGNVPVAVSKMAASTSALGDNQIANRMTGYFLQNLGNVGGNFESLKTYNYKDLEDWFFLSHSLDDQSNYVPFLAAYYFGAVEENPQKLDHVVNYLKIHGQLDYPQKWRWLAQAVYLARYKQENMVKALELANILANLKTDVAPWGRQMPAFINEKMGNKQASYEIMMRMLATEHESLHPNEINEMVNFICTRALSPQQATQNPLCQKSP